MNPEPFADALILTGPTASGKSSVSVLLAEQLGAEIISMDSMALYRGMDIGTAKPTAGERARVPHHLIDVLEPWEPASLAWWLEQAATACKDILRRGKRALIVGGTPLYLKGLLRGIFAGPPADLDLRRRLEARARPELHVELAKRDPVAAARLHPNDVRRLVRALEVLELTGRPISAWQQQFGQVRPRRYPPLWLDLPRDVLYQRIDERVLRMMEAGLLEEVRRLAQLPQGLGKEARQALGYKELLAHLTRAASLEEAVTAIQTRSRNFAKRQLTWFRHLEECQQLPITAEETQKTIAESVLGRWQAHKD